MLETARGEALSNRCAPAPGRQQAPMTDSSAGRQGLGWSTVCSIRTRLRWTTACRTWPRRPNGQGEGSEAVNGSRKTL